MDFRNLLLSAIACFMVSVPVTCQEFPDFGDSELKVSKETAIPEKLGKNPFEGTKVIKRPTTDVEDLKLKGKVKKLVIRAESATLGCKAKCLEKIRLFDQDGYLLRDIEFDHRGRPKSINFYGFVEGKRVVQRRHIKYSDDIGGIALGPIEVPPQSENAEDTKSSKPTERKEYNVELRYKHDKEGRLIKRELFFETGQPYSREEFERSGDIVKNTIWRFPYGTFCLKYALDKNGWITESDLCDPKSEQESYRKLTDYTSIDPKGNWLRKLDSFPGSIQPDRATLREIEYW